MRRYVWAVGVAICLCGATWAPDCDVVTLKVAVYAPDPEYLAGNVASTGVSIGADLQMQAGGSNSCIRVIGGKRYRFVVSTTELK